MWAGPRVTSFLLYTYMKTQCRLVTLTPDTLVAPVLKQLLYNMYACVCVC